MSIKEHFTDEELLYLLEAAKVALEDSDVYVFIAEKLDIDEDELTTLADKLFTYLEEV